MKDYLRKELLKIVLVGDGVAVPDDEREMNWRLFFAHSQDMQGFRADIFTGGPQETRIESFRGLRDRWPTSKTMIEALAQLWEDGATRNELQRITHPGLPQEEKKKGIDPALQLLSGVRGSEATRVFVQALREFKSRKTKKMVRAYVQNSHTLKPFGWSFRAYLQGQASLEAYAPDRIPEAEQKWTTAIMRDFYNVGPALANYLISDWLLWLWREGRIAWFESYKPDSVFLKAVQQGRVPKEAAPDFVAYCRTLRIPEGYGVLSGRPCPPRVLNECIWLDGKLGAG